MEFLEKQWKLIVGVFAVFVVVGLGISWMSGNSVKQEKTAQEKFADLDAKYTQYKEESTKRPDQKESETKDKPAPVDVQALKKDLEDFTTKYAGSTAAQMAGLDLADLYLAEKKTTEALAALKRVETQDNQLTNVLVQKKIGQTLADLKQCPEAIQVWDKILKNKNASFAHVDVKINQALCYHSMNDTKKAEDILVGLKNEKSDATNSAGKEAERILRLIQFNKTSGT